MRLVLYSVLISLGVGFCASADAQASNQCWHVPTMERDISRYLKTILSTYSTEQLAAIHIPASDTSTVVVVTDSAVCGAVAAANQRATRVDSLGTPRPVVVERTGNTSVPTSVRYIVWDNIKLGEWWSLTVFGPNFEFYNGFTM